MVSREHDPGGRGVDDEAIDPGRGHLEGLIDLDCSAGRVYYYKVAVDRESSTPAITALDPEEGRRLVAERTPAAKN